LASEFVKKKDFTNVQSKKIDELELLKGEPIFSDLESFALNDGYIISILKNSVNEFQSVVSMQNQSIRHVKIQKGIENRKEIILSYSKLYSY